MFPPERLLNEVSHLVQRLGNRHVAGLLHGVDDVDDLGDWRFDRHGVDSSRGVFPSRSVRVRVASCERGTIIPASHVALEAHRVVLGQKYNFPLDFLCSSEHRDSADHQNLIWISCRRNLFGSRPSFLRKKEQS